MGKCSWIPLQIVEWNGLIFNLEKSTISIMAHRIEKVALNIDTMLNIWPKVTFRTVAKLVGQIISMAPVLKGQFKLKLEWSRQ